LFWFELAYDFVARNHLAFHQCNFEFVNFNVVKMVSGGCWCRKQITQNLTTLKFTNSKLHWWNARWFLATKSYASSNQNKVKCLCFGILRIQSLGPCGLVVRRLPRMRKVVGSNPTEGGKHFSKFFNFTVIKCFKF
jgi:hypothetical protein